MGSILYYMENNYNCANTEKGRGQTIGTENVAFGQILPTLCQTVENPGTQLTSTPCKGKR